MNIKGIGDEVSVRRKSLGISQKDLARISEISVHALSDVESGKGNPTVETLGKIIDPLGLELVVSVKVQE